MRSVLPASFYIQKTAGGGFGLWLITHHLLLHIQFSVLALNEQIRQSHSGLGGNNVFATPVAKRRNSGKAATQVLISCVDFSGNGGKLFRY